MGALVYSTSSVVSRSSTGPVSRWTGRGMPTSPAPPGGATSRRRRAPCLTPNGFRLAPTLRDEAGAGRGEPRLLHVPWRRRSRLGPGDRAGRGGSGLRRRQFALDRLPVRQSGPDRAEGPPGRVRHQAERERHGIGPLTLLGGGRDVPGQSGHRLGPGHRRRRVWKHLCYGLHRRRRLSPGERLRRDARWARRVRDPSSARTERCCSRRSSAAAGRRMATGLPSIRPGS